MDENEDIMTKKRELFNIRGVITVLCLLLLPVIPKTFAAEIPITTNSKEALQLFIQGRDKLANVQMPDAAKLFDQAIEKDPNFALAYLYRAISSNNYNITRENLQKAKAHNANISPGEKLLINYSEAAFDGNTVEQKEYVNQLLQGYSDDKWVQQTAGQFYYGQDQFQKALTHFNETIKLDHNFAPAYNMIGYTQSMLGNNEEAEQAFKTYISLVPDNPNPYDSYAELLLKTGRYDESIAQYKKALSIDPNFVSSLLGIGNNYIFKGDYQSAREYYDQEYEKAPNDAAKMNALYWKAVSYIHEGDIPQAMEMFSKEREMAQKDGLTPNIISNYITTGFVLSHSGNVSDGMEHLAKAASLIKASDLPEPTKEGEMIGYTLAKSYSLLLNNKLEDAMAEASQAKKMIDKRQNVNEQKRYSFVVGVMELMQNNNEKALSHFKEADTESPLTWYYKAAAYDKMGNKEKSAKIYDKILKWNVNSIDLAMVRGETLRKMKSVSMSTDK